MKGVALVCVALAALGICAGSASASVRLSLGDGGPIPEGGPVEVGLGVRSAGAPEMDNCLFTWNGTMGKDPAAVVHATPGTVVSDECESGTFEIANAPTSVTFRANGIATLKSHPALEYTEEAGCKYRLPTLNGAFNPFDGISAANFHTVGKLAPGSSFHCPSGKELEGSIDILHETDIEGFTFEFVVSANDV
jgi:hypothetical protein